MIYSNSRIVEPGRLGTVKDYAFNPPPEPDVATASLDPTETAGPAEKSDPAVFLGEVNGRVYRYFPDDFDISSAGEQAPEIDFRPEPQLDEETRLALRAQRTCAFQKEQAREKIEMDVGDVLDLMADMGQLIEFAVIAVSALCADRSGAVPMSQETIKDYGLRGAAVLQAVSAGKLMLRSSYEAPEKMITTIMPRYSRVQEIVRDKYINLLKEWGL